MKEEILKEYKYKTELHAHTLPISLCSGVYAEELVKIYKEMGTDFHKLGQQGGCFIRTKTKLQDSHDVMQILKNKDFVFEIFENIVLPY